MWTADGTDWGLEYMFGVLGAGGDFRPLWAHNRREERKALKAFLEMVRKRRKRYPKRCTYLPLRGVRADSPVAAGRTLWRGRRTRSTTCCATCVLVDLYPLVRKSIRVGTENYSLKSLEPLYMGAELRAAATSPPRPTRSPNTPVTAKLLADGRPDEAATVLKQIEDYNLYDCRSTRILRELVAAACL